MSMLRYLASWFLFASATIGQQIWKVNSQGSPGAQFVDIPAAVAAASPGDEIWVYYDYGLPIPSTTYHAPVITKPLRIMAVFASVGGGGPGVHPIAAFGPLIIMGIPAGQRVEIHGLSIGADSPPTGLAGAIIVLDCQGDVLLDSVEMGSYGGPTTFGRIERCNNVVLRGCDITMSGDPFRIIDSQVLMTTTAVYYSLPFLGSYAYAATTESVRLTNSTLTAVGSLIAGVNASYYIQGPYLEKSGVVIESGVLRVGPASTIVGGVDPPWYQASGVTVLNPAVGSVRIDPRGTVVNPGAPMIPETMHSTFHSWVVANETFGVTVAGPANGFALLTFGDWLPNTQSPLGPLAMDPNAMLPVALVALPAPSGYFQWTLNCPLTAPVAHAYALQALTIAPNGTLGVTVPSPLTVAWPRGIIP